LSRHGTCSRDPPSPPPTRSRLRAWCAHGRLQSAPDDTADTSQRTIRAFLKSRTSYDVLPISYRLIVLDTALLVKKSLNILNQNGKRAHMCRPPIANVACRHRLCAAVGLQVIHLCRSAYNLRLHQRHPVLLAESRRSGPGRPVPPEQPSRFVAALLSGDCG
jgi:hypothetical protein